MRKGDLQGTMSDEERMISAETLTLILIAAGTIAGAKRGKNGSTGLRGRMEITVGGAEIGRGASGFSRLACLWTAMLLSQSTKTFSKIVVIRSGLFCWP